MTHGLHGPWLLDRHYPGAGERGDTAGGGADCQRAVFRGVAAVQAAREGVGKREVGGGNSEAMKQGAIGGGKQ